MLNFRRLFGFLLLSPYRAVVFFLLMTVVCIDVATADSNGTPGNQAPSQVVMMGAENSILSGVVQRVKANGSGQILTTVSSLPGAIHGATSQVTALSNGTANLATRATRRYVAVFNTSTTETIYYGYSSGVNGSSGFPLGPQSSQSLNVTVAVYIYSASNAAVVAFSESYD